MAYDAQAELKRVMEFYSNDPLQRRFSALITGVTGSGKSYLLRTCRHPCHIDSFDPGGTKGLRPWIRSKENPNGQIIADTSYENEDPYNPTVFEKWKKDLEIRLRTDYFSNFGTYMLDSASMWADAVMGSQLKSVNKAGEAPKWNRDYTPQKVLMINYIKKLMSLPCDFILTGHLREQKETVGLAKDGTAIEKINYRFFTTGQGMITIPLQFDELYVMEGTETSAGVKREIILEAQGKYIARSRLKSNANIPFKVKADMKDLLKKFGFPHEDKAPLPALT